MTNYAKLNLLFFFSFTVPAAMQAIKHRQRKAIKHRQRKKKIGEKKIGRGRRKLMCTRTTTILKMLISHCWIIFIIFFFLRNKHTP